MPIWCQRGPSPQGIGAREKYSAGATAAPGAKAQAAFTTDGRRASSSLVIGVTSVPTSTSAGSASGVSTARNCAGGSVGKSPCRFTTTS